MHVLKRLARAVVAHWGAKLVALLAAIGLWAFVVNSGFTQEVLAQPVPLQARDVASDLAIAGQLPSVQVEVRAPTPTFTGITPDQLHAVVDAAGLLAGTHTLAVQVTADDPNVQIIAMTPAVVEVKLEKRATKTFSVELETQGDLGQGFVADTTTLTPKRVDVSGAASTLANVAKVVVRLQLNGETGTVEKTLTPEALDADRNTLTGLF
ncbi:MAG: CdaR family protein [Candidatus Andersenbacteria bacterium]